MPKLILVLATCTAAACSPATGSHPSERVEPQPLPVDTAPARPAAVDLSGAWATGSAGEPDVPRLVLRLQCNYTPPLWVLDQRGDTVRAWAMPESRAQGIATTRNEVSTVGAEGRLRGVNLTMTRGASRYVLRYDSTSGHLRGTLNGAPFWAVRQTLERAQGCIPVP